MKFPPGTYTFNIDAKFFPKCEKDRIEQCSYRTLGGGVPLPVSLSLQVSAWIAMLGGFIAYLFTALREGGDLSGGVLSKSRKELWDIARKLVSAMLLSAVITVLAGRVSDTQFPIKVSIADFWGALAIGFTAYFVGYQIVDRLGKTTEKKP